MRLSLFAVVLAFGLFTSSALADQADAGPSDAVTAAAPTLGDEIITNTEAEAGAGVILVMAVLGALLRSWRYRALLFKFAPVAFNIVNDICARTPNTVDDKVGLFLVELGKLMGKELSPKEQALATSLAAAMHGQEKAQEKILATAQVLADNAKKHAEGIPARF